ncbi:histidine kinase [Modestobacter sp. I12A-02628]|uniref:histidine kinase n=1 Tax=Goekera deserti TaxID=2497753 RepID=A0A7K3WD52_9ACTN|nr:ATP-binding protein [Goekera deserti]MPQ97008.1 histidine kinase [Goekera deserti]NDI46677.1 cyclic nucleotide-binding domain-containing protein [Goekera deserti]NEL54246.1 cyclic nucleotide-binding domain-containing protein [Goekera deserti]
MTAPACDPELLRTLFLFEALDDEQLEWLCGHGELVDLEPGHAYREGEPATCLYVLVEGEIALSRRVGSEDVEVTRTAQRGVYGGAFTAYLGNRIPQTYSNSLRVVVPSRFFVLDAARFAELVTTWFPMAVHLLEGLFFGAQNTQAAIGQRERLLALGSLSAGLTHELNNPAGAAVRATSALRDRLAGMRAELRRVAEAPLDRDVVLAMVALQDKAVARVATAPDLSALEAADREEELGEWFEDHDVAGGWDLAAGLAQVGIDPAWLDELATHVPPGSLDGIVRWLAGTVELELLTAEIVSATTRISQLVGAARQYSQLDRAPVQTVDVHDLLTSTLIMLKGRFPETLRVVKDYDRSLPQVTVLAAELNQVWTNLIDNAVQAMGEAGGTLTLHTARDGEHLLVEVRDTGPGIDPAVQPRVFEPFFTTKPVGQGTGLGLDISWRIVVHKHRGDLSVSSVPGDTRFRVRIPLTPPEAAP